MAWLFLLRLLATLLHAALVFAVAPLLMGVTVKCRAWALGRRGPPAVQPYRELYKLLRKTTLVPETATELFALWPAATFLATATAAVLVPGFCTGLLTAPLGDVITLVGLLAFARAAAMLGGLETGFGFGGAGVGRAILFGVFAEAALLVVLLGLVLLAHASTLDGMALAFAGGHTGMSVALGFALVALLAVALTGAARGPGGQNELAMVHKAMALEYSGRFLLLLDYAAMLRLLLWMDLIGTIFLPFGMARADAILSWPGGLLLWGIKLAGMAGALALYEVSRARLRLFRVPEFLGGAMLLGILAGVFLFVTLKAGP